MNHARKLTLPIAFVICLSACGGGGGGGGGLASTPPPPGPNPTTTPAATVGAPAVAGIPNANLMPTAIVGGPTLDSHAATTFPLLQTVMTVGASSTVADSATISGGGTLRFSSGRDTLTLNLGNSALGISDVVAGMEQQGLYKATVGTKQAFVQIGARNPGEYNWTSYGFWGVVRADGTRSQAAFVTGFATPGASVPTSGTANYSGIVEGEVILPQANRANGVNYLALNGDASIQANFGTGSVVGSLTNMATTDFEGYVTPWNSVSLTASFGAGQNLFTGTTAAISAPGTYGSLAGTATGTIAGMFFGPAAQQVGAVWTLSDGIGAAFGSISPGDPNPWDY